MEQCVLILGYGEMSHAMEYLLSARHNVRIWDMGTMVKGYLKLLQKTVSCAI